ncbi:MAG TPA: hypothetical protein VNE42_08005 [Acidimicrobiales bacterium]|nr:hypothetical protein [Acidimicrobiales bacterium]
MTGYIVMTARGRLAGRAPDLWHEARYEKQFTANHAPDHSSSWQKIGDTVGLGFMVADNPR